MTHTTSMAVWGIPAPVIMNRPFKVTVGLSCSASCCMAGTAVEIRDEAGKKVGDGRLGDKPWPGTTALHVAEVEIHAPSQEGVLSWSAHFIGEASLHPDAAAAFSFRIARPPDHKVTVEIVAKETEAPLAKVEVRMGLYGSLTDENGLAVLELPKGTYDLNLSKTGYQAAPMTIDVMEDCALRIEALPAPPLDPEDDHVWM